MSAIINPTLELTVTAAPPQVLVVSAGNVGPPGLPGAPGVDGAPGEGSFNALTVDTFEPYRMILFSDGRVMSIPFATPDPVMPTGLATLARISSVSVTWVAAPLADHYRVYRNGVFYATADDANYRDLDITVGSTYTYQVQTVDQYGQRSAITAAVTAFIDPALNVAPTVSVRSWPANFPSNGQTVIRVNARDINAQVLAFELDVDEGTITATDDPSVWIYQP